jgi:phosphoenolpyruvate carboxylase
MIRKRVVAEVNDSAIMMNRYANLEVDRHFQVLEALLSQERALVPTNWI